MAAFPSLLYAVFCFGLPESPRWLLSRKGDRAAALDVLQRIEPEVSKPEIAAQADEIIAASSEQVSSGHFWTRRLQKPIRLAILIAFFNQLSGINAILYFAPRIFELTGLAAKAALLQSIGIGVTNLVFTFVGLCRSTDWDGARFSTSARSAISFARLSRLSPLHNHLSIVPVCIFAFIAARRRPVVIWVLISEIFQPSQCGRSDAGQFHALDLCRSAHNFLPADGCVLPARLRFLVFRWHDGASVALGKNHGP